MVRLDVRAYMCWERLSEQLMSRGRLDGMNLEERFVVYKKRDDF